MFLVLKKRNLLACGLLCCFFAAFAVLLWTGHSKTVPVFAALGEERVTLVIDPGHGGEDGGAVSADGAVKESGLNLSIALRVEDLMTFLGQPTVMTRREDVSIHSQEAATARQKKVSDLHNRVALVNGTEGAVLLSIHQNSLPSSTVTHGAQVFWNQQEGAEELAGAIQESLNSSVNIGNEKHTKRIPPTVYLMKHVTVPAVLVECGFLTNPEETRLLQDETYQRGLAVSIAAGYLRGISEGETA